MVKKTPVYEYHKRHGHIIDYAGFDLSVWFEGIIPECKSVRTSAGLFDVSHMGRITVEGKNAEAFLNGLTTNDVSALAISQGHYTLLCNPKGGIIDDMTIFRMTSAKYLVVYNAANREKNWNWFQKNREHDNLTLLDISDQSAMFAVQGPKAAGLLRSVSDVRLDEIEKYSSREATVEDVPCFVTRSGYTGEDGFEIYIWKTSYEHSHDAVRVWDKLLSEGRQLGLKPAGLGARDVLRLEAGMCLYGNDIDEQTTPVEARLNFVVRLDKKNGFVGREPIQHEKDQGPPRVRVGFKMQEKGIPRQGQEVVAYDERVGKVTSGTFSPTLGLGVGMAYVTSQLAKPGEHFQVKIRERSVPAEIVKLPFYQRRSENRVVVLGEEMGLRDFRMKYSPTASKAGKISS